MFKLSNHVNHELFYVFVGLKASLERLQLDYVDIVFANKPDPHTPMEGKLQKCPIYLLKEKNNGENSKKWKLYKHVLNIEFFLVSLIIFIACHIGVTSILLSRRKLFTWK